MFTANLAILSPTHTDITRCVDMIARSVCSKGECARDKSGWLAFARASCLILIHNITMHRTVGTLIPASYAAKVTLQCSEAQDVVEALSFIEGLVADCKREATVSLTTSD